jgi:transposase
MKAPAVMMLSAEQVQTVLSRVQTAVTPSDYEIIAGLAQTVQRLSELLENKELTLARLRQMLFGIQSERKEKVFPQAESDSIGAAGRTDQGGEASEKKPGHGRNGAEDYAGATRIQISHPEMKTGCACPRCQRGKMYQMDSGQVVRIVGRPPLQATVYEPERWRCNVCGEIVTAPLPPEACGEKYDDTAGSMIALLKYGSGMPFNRLETLQEGLQVPLPATTQWEIVEEVAGLAKPAWEKMLSAAAQGQVLHNDDTTMTVLSLEKENNSEDPPERKGVFTTGLVAEVDGRKIGVFLTGRQHAGERLEELLKRRAAELSAPIQMCDALERNLPKELKTVLANCLAHGRRKFVEAAGNFPTECRYVLDRLAEVYRNDEWARQQGMTPDQRLAFHQARSNEPMQCLHEWLELQVAKKKVEPNSGLGQAIHYMLKHWQPLTLFLRQPGAPLDNNVCERALKQAILHRKNAYFYKTEHGAQVGDILMSLIHTCRLNSVNPFDYLTALQQYADRVKAAPANWLPWNYHQQLAAGFG